MVQDDMERAGKEKGQYEIQDPSFGYVSNQHSKIPPSSQYLCSLPFYLILIIWFRTVNVLTENSSCEQKKEM